MYEGDSKSKVTRVAMPKLYSRVEWENKQHGLEIWPIKRREKRKLLKKQPNSWRNVLHILYRITLTLARVYESDSKSKVPRILVIS